MARFERGDLQIELVHEDTRVVEHTPYGSARRDLHDERAALIAYYARIADLLADRWIRTTPFVDDLVVAPEPTLVEAIDAGDRDALAVYTDWLIERGDPRGELAALRAASEPDERKIGSLEKTRGVELFGPLCMLPRTWREHFAYVWRQGWIDEVVFARVEQDVPLPPDAELMQHALHAPMARFARWLSVDTWYSTPIWECLGACSCLRRIRGLRYASAMACHREMLDALPALEELELLDCDSTSGGHRGVRRMRMHLRITSLAELAGEWPSLRRLELAADNSIALARSLKVLDLPQLREVVIEADELVDDVVRMVVDRTAHLETLEIRAQLSEDARRMLAARPS
jgi:hypothetical protein